MVDGKLVHIHTFCLFFSKISKKNYKKIEIDIL